MGVPALVSLSATTPQSGLLTSAELQFRWLSRKYPKVCMPVVEEHAVTIPGKDGAPDEVIVSTRERVWVRVPWTRRSDPLDSRSRSIPRGRTRTEKSMIVYTSI